MKVLIIKGEGLGPVINRLKDRFRDSTEINTINYLSQINQFFQQGYTYDKCIVLLPSRTIEGYEFQMLKPALEDFKSSVMANGPAMQEIIFVVSNEQEGLLVTENTCTLGTFYVIEIPHTLSTADLSNLVTQQGRTLEAKYTAYNLATLKRIEIEKAKQEREAQEAQSQLDDPAGFFSGSDDDIEGGFGGFGNLDDSTDDDDDYGGTLVGGVNGLDDADYGPDPNEAYKQLNLSDRMWDEGEDLNPNQPDQHSDNDNTDDFGSFGGFQGFNDASDSDSDGFGGFDTPPEPQPSSFQDDFERPQPTRLSRKQQNASSGEFKGTPYDNYDDSDNHDEATTDEFSEFDEFDEFGQQQSAPEPEEPPAKTKKRGLATKKKPAKKVEKPAPKKKSLFGFGKKSEEPEPTSTLQSATKKRKLGKKQAEEELENPGMIAPADDNCDETPYDGTDGMDGFSDNFDEPEELPPAPQPKKRAMSRKVVNEQPTVEGSDEFDGDFGVELEDNDDSDEQEEIPVKSSENYDDAYGLFDDESQDDEPQDEPDLTPDLFDNKTKGMAKGRGKGLGKKVDTSKVTVKGKVTKKAKAAPDLTKRLALYRNRGAMLVFTGSPGTGKTMIAGNMANLLCKMGYSVCVLDLDTIGKGQVYLNLDIADMVHSRMNDSSNNVGALNSSGTDFSRYLDVVRPGLHMITSSLGSDSIRPDEVVNNRQFNRLIHELTSAYNFVIVDVQFQDLKSQFTDFIDSADSLIFVEEATTHGMVNFMLNLTNVEDEALQSVIFHRGNLILNREDGMNTFLGRKVDDTNKLLQAIDEVVAQLTGSDAEFHFADLKVSGVIPYNKNFEPFWYSKSYVSDTANGEKMFQDLLQACL